MDISTMKNMVVLRDLPSNLIESNSESRLLKR